MTWRDRLFELITRLLAAFGIYQAGRASERARATQEALDAAKMRQAVETDLRRSGADAGGYAERLQGEGSRWRRD